MIKRTRNLGAGLGCASGSCADLASAASSFTAQSAAMPALPQRICSATRQARRRGRRLCRQDVQHKQQAYYCEGTGHASGFKPNNALSAVRVRPSCRVRLAVPS